MNGNEIRTSSDQGSVVYGLLICWGLNTLQIVTGFITLGAGAAFERAALVIVIASIGAVGLVQLVYVLPLYFQFRKKGKPDTAKGLVIAASITALLNATCWGLFKGGI